MKNKLVSIVVPAYNEEESIPLFMEEISKVFASIENVQFECIFIDDGSNDSTLEVLEYMFQKYPQVKYISFSRNFGKEAALLAGLTESLKGRGDFIAVMDADLQDPPSLLPEMLNAITEEGFDCVATRRVTRKGEPPIRSFFAKCFYKIINKISDTQMEDGARDFRLMKRQVVEAVLSLREYNRFSKGLFSWVGFSTKWIAYDNIERVAGTTKWSFGKLLLYSLDGIIAFSVKPLMIASLFGILFCFIAILGLCFIIVRWFAFGDPVAGWASTATIILLVGGIQLFCVGILGQYLAKAYMELKRRPSYIVKLSRHARKDE